MSDGRNIIYLYDGSFEGLLCTVFESYSLHVFPTAIEITGNGQQSFFAQYRHVATDSGKAERVADKVIALSGQYSLHEIYQCYLSDLPGREMYIFNYIRACMKFGTEVDRHLTIECVNAVTVSSRAVGSEAHLYTGFVRFSELENGVYYAKIEPKNNVLPIIEPHFRHRYASMPFIIHDTVRRQCLVYNGKTSVIHGDVDAPSLELSRSERDYKKLWKEFYDTIVIKERHNEKCRMTHMPKRYWRCLTEFEQDLSASVKTD